MLECRDLQFSYGADTFALHGISLRLGAGQILCLLGPNGAGKSTLLQCLLGLETRWTGEITVAGRSARSLSRMEIARRIAYVPQATVSAFSFTAEQYVMLGRTPHFQLGQGPAAGDRLMVDAAFSKTGLEALRHRQFSQLSGGERQLVLLARALATDAAIIVLDEPTASLDLGNQARVLRIIRELAALGRAILMTTHLPDQAFLLNCEVALMKAGKMLATGTPTVVCTERSLSALYAAPVRLLSQETETGQIVGACIPRLD